MKRHKEKKELTVSEIIKIANTLFPEIDTGTIKFRYDNRDYSVGFYNGEVWKTGG